MEFSDADAPLAESETGKQFVNKEYAHQVRLPETNLER